jgi:hypothetical protein
MPGEKFFLGPTLIVFALFVTPYKKFLARLKSFWKGREISYAYLDLAEPWVKSMIVRSKYI